MKKDIYLDHNATTPVDEEVLEAMLPYLRDRFGNASSVHYWGKEARYGVEKARMQLASLLSVPEATLTFTGCGSESNNTILRSVAYRFSGKGCHIIASSIEHPCVSRCLEDLEKSGQITVSWVNPQSNGAISRDQVAAAFREDTRLVSIMLANNETGAISPLREIADFAHERGAEVHSDTVQALGKIPVQPTDLGLDYATFSAHKLYGPKGVGAFYARDPRTVLPMIRGGGQENRLRAGTENVPFIVAFGAAAEKCDRILVEESRRLAELRDSLETGLRQTCRETLVCAEDAERLPGTSCICFRGLKGTYLVLDLAEDGIAVSSGSACSANQSKPSHVLEAMGIAPDWSQGAVRFSLGRSNTSEQIQTAIQSVQRAIQRQLDHPPREEETLDLLSLCD